jgi:hypothetical protein
MRAGASPGTPTKGSTSKLSNPGILMCEAICSVNRWDTDVRQYSIFINRYEFTANGLIRHPIHTI